MNATLPLVSLICTAHADDAVVHRFHGALFRVLRPLETAYRFEIVYAGANLAAATTACIQSLAQLDPRIRVLGPASLKLVGYDPHPRWGLAEAAMVVFLDVSTHSPELLPQLLELAKGPALWIEGAPAPAATSPGRRRMFAKTPPSAPPLLLAKRSAIEQVPADGSLTAWSDAMKRANIVRAELQYVPNVAEPTREPLQPWVAAAIAMCRKTPPEFISYFGATIVIVGLFLAVWFTVQGLVARDSVWFSWCYLIVLLHILGGSILLAMGKVAALATRIMERLDAQPMPEKAAIAPAAALREAA